MAKIKTGTGVSMTALAYAALALSGQQAFAQATESEAAQSADMAAEARDTERSLGVVTVTAQRRAESASDVGMSIVAASGDQMLEKGVMEPADLVKIVPGLTYTETPYGTGVLTLRGVGFYESSLAASSPVATYIDEIALPYPRMAQGAGLDAERVEVLKGPQGTLYGQNTTGGLVNYVSAKPTDELEAGFTGSFGRFSQADLEGYLSGPLTDTLRARAALRVQSGDGWQESATRNDTLGETEVLAGRILLDWAPSDSLSFLLNITGFVDKSDTRAGQAIFFSPATPNVQPEELDVLLIPPGDNREADWTPGREFDKDNDFYQVALKAELSLGDIGDLISITSYQDYNQEQWVDADGSNLELADVSQDGSVESFSQELRLQGEQGMVRYVIGGNYSDDSIFDDTIFAVGDSSTAWTVPVLPIRYSRTWSTQDVQTWAVFGGLDFAFTDQLTLQTGVRYTEQERDFTGCIGDPGDGAWATLFSAAYGTVLLPGECTTLDPFTGEIGAVTDTLSEDNVSWRIGLNYEPNEDVLLYANVSEGYKAGSFPTVGGVLSVQYVPATQESLLAYEVGTKITFHDPDVQLNGAVFYYDYTDKQFRGKILDSFFGSIEQLYNVPQSSVTGAEVSFLAAPIDGLTLNGAVTWLDSEVDSSFDGLTPIATPVNLQGESFEFTPEWSGNFGFEYANPVSASKDFFFGADVRYQDETHAGYGGLDIFEIDAYTILDAWVGVRAPDNRWSLRLWGRNLTDEYYITNANYLGEYVYRLTGDPVTYGIGFSIRG